MRKATAIYHAPEGDSKVVEMGGVTFFDGHSVDLNTDDHGHMISKLVNNRLFEIEVSADDEPAKRKPGRPSNAEKAAAEAAEAAERERINAESEAKAKAEAEAKAKQNAVT